MLNSCNNNIKRILSTKLGPYHNLLGPCHNKCYKYSFCVYPYKFYTFAWAAAYLGYSEIRELLLSIFQSFLPRKFLQFLGCVNIQYIAICWIWYLQVSCHIYLQISTHKHTKYYIHTRFYIHTSINKNMCSEFFKLKFSMKCFIDDCNKVIII